MIDKSGSFLIIASMVAFSMLGCIDLQKDFQLVGNRYLARLDFPRFDMNIGKSEKWVFDNFGQPCSSSVLPVKYYDNELISFDDQLKNEVVKEVYYHFENGELIFWLCYDAEYSEWRVIRDVAIPVDWEF